MKKLLLLGSLLALVALAGCTKEPEAAPAVEPPPGVKSNSAGPGAVGGQQMQPRPAGATSNQ